MLQVQYSWTSNCCKLVEFTDSPCLKKKKILLLSITMFLLGNCDCDRPEWLSPENSLIPWLIPLTHYRNSRSWEVRETGMAFPRTRSKTFKSLTHLPLGLLRETEIAFPRRQLTSLKEPRKRSMDYGRRSRYLFRWKRSLKLDQIITNFHPPPPLCSKLYKFTFGHPYTRW